MKLSISVTGADGRVKAYADGDGSARLVYRAVYEEGDVIRLSPDAPGHTVAQLEDSISPAYGFLKAGFALTVPFGEKRSGYSPKSFTGDTHLLWARAAEPEEISARRNLALNPLDSHGNSGLFPHADANVETRGEAVFAARNAINGNVTSAGHGPWPYESWGINQNPDAQIRVVFGREVLIDRLVVTLRADFPHDNWWKRATARFSDGSSETLHFVKSGNPQGFDIAPRVINRLTLSELVKDETDPSPFPALVQLECWGVEAGSR